MRLRTSAPRPILVLTLIGILTACSEPDSERSPASATTQDSPAAMPDPFAARSAALELDTPQEPVPGDPLDHHMGGYAKVLCSAVHITGLTLEDAMANVGGFTAPFEVRSAATHVHADGGMKLVTVQYGDDRQRTAQLFHSQGCITLELGADTIRFEPSRVEPQTPDPSTTPWPMGDLLEQRDTGLDAAVVQRAIDAIMRPDGKTLGVVITHRGQLVGEAYGPEVDLYSPLESWSMGKSLTGTLMAVLIEQGEYELWQPAPIPEWQGTPKADIRIGDILRMSSGIRIRAPRDPDYDPSLGYPDHLYLYTGPNAFRWAATRPQQWPPGTVGRYRNTDPVLTNYLIRLAVEARGEDYHAFPQRNLFDKLGIRSIVMETDPYGNFLTQGYEFGSARDWARLGNLYLQDGIWQGERILPEGYVDYAFTVAPGWEADGRPVYGGGLMWLREFESGETAGMFAGAGGQQTLIFRDQQLVVARLGKYSGAAPAADNLTEAVGYLLEALSED